MSFDADYKRLFSYPELVRDLLIQFVPGPWREVVRWDTLERVPESFVAENDRQRHDDLIWRVRTGEGWLWIYVIIVQSEPDEWMALRALVYLGLLAQRLVQQDQLIDGKLPPIVPVVLYRGSRPWRAPLDVADCFLVPPHGLETFVPRLRYHLIDEARLQLHDDQVVRNLAAAFFRLEQTRDLDDLKRFYVALDLALRRPALRGLRRALVRWLIKRLRRSGDEEKTLDELESELLGDATVLEEVIEREFSRAEERGRRLGWQQGKLEGMQQGMQQGKLQGEALILLRLMQRRFGSTLPTWVEERLFAADEAQIFAWGDRLFEAQNIEDVFATN